MAGLGRRTHYRKHLTDSIIYDFPEPGENERIAKVTATRGGNQFDIILPSEAGAAQDCSNSQHNKEHKQQRDGQLAILPTKFNKLVWVKRNDFVIVETGVDDDHQDTTTTNNHENKNDSSDVASSDHNATTTTTTTTRGIRFIISHILYKDQVKHLQSKGLWPMHDPEFATDKIMGLRDHLPPETTAADNDNNKTNEEEEEAEGDGITYDMGYEDDAYLVNTNRIANLKVDDSSDDDSSDEE